MNRRVAIHDPLNEMLIEGASLEACHGKQGRGIPVLLTGVEFGERDRA
jgi:hypothetical protein